MAHNAVLRWLDGRGWLVLAGATPASDAIRAHALSIGAADGGVAYVATRGANDAADQLLQEMEALGAQAGYLVDVLSEDDDVIRENLADSGMIVIGGDNSVTQVRSVLLGAAIEGIRVAYENGAVVLVEGPAAMAFGAWVVQDDGRIAEGLAWLHDGLIVPGVSSVAAASITRDALTAHPTSIALGIGREAALALGPDGQVEPWGSGEVSIALGPDLSA
jgi:hypothetical protein